MLIVIDGEDIVSSRNRLNEQIKDRPVIRIDGKKQTLDEVFDKLSSNSLFSSEKIIVIEYFSKIKPLPKLFEELNKYSNDQATTIILWDDVVLRNKNVEQKDITRYTFSFPKVFFNLLDEFSPNSNRTMELLHNVLKTNAPEQVFFALAKRVRHLLYIKSGQYEFNSEFKKMIPWQLSKIKKQANLWDEATLKKTFIKFARTDEQIKTSNLTLPLAKHLDILLTSTIN